MACKICDYKTIQNACLKILKWANGTLIFFPFANLIYTDISYINYQKYFSGNDKVILWMQQWNF